MILLVTLTMVTSTMVTLTIVAMETSTIVTIVTTMKSTMVTLVTWTMMTWTMIALVTSFIVTLTFVNLTTLPERQPVFFGCESTNQPTRQFKDCIKKVENKGVKQAVTLNLVDTTTIERGLYNENYYEVRLARWGYLTDKDFL